jgi:hypothetical protein
MANADIDEVLGKLKSGVTMEELEPDERKLHGKYKGSRRDYLLHTLVSKLSSKDLVEGYSMFNTRRKTEAQAVIMLRSQMQMEGMNKAMTTMAHRIGGQGALIGKLVHYGLRMTKLLALLIELNDKKSEYGKTIQAIMKEKAVMPEK